MAVMSDDDLAVALAGDLPNSLRLPAIVADRPSLLAVIAPLASWRSRKHPNRANP